MRGTMQAAVNGVAVGATLGGAAAALYHFGLRSWHLCWGATDAEVALTLPGDGLVADAMLVSTRAITIHAPIADVWPWLVQMGEGRGGFYSYTWLENMAGCRMENADHVLPEHQHREVGDTIWLARWWNERFGYPSYLEVAVVDPGRSLVLRSPEAPRSGDDFSCAFVLQEEGPQTTRLIVRSRSVWGQGPGRWLLGRVMGEPAHFVMERAMMLGIKERAEAAALRQQVIRER